MINILKLSMVLGKSLILIISLAKGHCPMPKEFLNIYTDFAINDD